MPPYKHSNAFRPDFDHPPTFELTNQNAPLSHVVLALDQSERSILQPTNHRPSRNVSQTCAYHCSRKFWYKTRVQLPSLPFIFISFCSLANSLSPFRPVCCHNFPLFFINVTLLERFFQGVFVARPLAGPLSVHCRRVALVACCSACIRDVQTILAETVLAMHLSLASWFARVHSRLGLCCTI